MTDPKQNSKILKVSVWSVLILLSASLLWAAALKLFRPVDQLALMWPWAGELPVLMRLTGLFDLLGGLGLLLPALLRIKQRLTVFAAAGIFLLMIVAGIFHVMRGETSVIGVNVVFATMAAFVAWGRSKQI